MRNKPDPRTLPIRHQPGTSGPKATQPPRGPIPQVPSGHWGTGGVPVGPHPSPQYSPLGPPQGPQVQPVRRRIIVQPPEPPKARPGETAEHSPKHPARIEDRAAVERKREEVYAAVYGERSRIKDKIALAIYDALTEHWVYSETRRVEMAQALARDARAATRPKQPTVDDIISTVSRGIDWAALAIANQKAEILEQIRGALQTGL